MSCKSCYVHPRVNNNFASGCTDICQDSVFTTSECVSFSWTTTWNCRV